jgi:hypothetical protein
MQQLGAATITVDGVTVFSDHADPNQFWYLPSPVALAKRQSDGRPAFTFIKWRPAAVEAGAKGGGFLMLEANLKLPEDTERSIRAKLRQSGTGEDIRLSAIPFDQGTVKCIALDLEGAGGTAAQANDQPGTFRAVEAISGATVPSLSGDNVAAFSLTLSQEGLHAGDDTSRCDLQSNVHHSTAGFAGNDHRQIRGHLHSLFSWN